MKVMNGLVITFEEDKRFLCVWLFYYVFKIRERRCQDIDQVLLHEIIFFCLSVFSSSEELDKITSIRSKLPTAACSCEANLHVESDLGTADTTDKSFTVFSVYSSPVEALNLIVDSKSQSVELDNSTIRLHVPSRRKKRLQSYCSVDFDFLSFIGI